MPNSTYYVQECPTCGRTLQVRVEHLGKNVVCQHCAARFQAIDPNSGSPGSLETSGSLLARAEQLIESATRANRGSGIGQSKRLLRFSGSATRFAPAHRPLIASAGRTGFFEVLKEARVGFGRAAWIADYHTWLDKSRNSEAHCHPMVVVGLDLGRQ